MKIKSFPLLVLFLVFALHSYATPPRYYFKMAPLTGDSHVRDHVGEIVVTGYALNIDSQSDPRFILQKTVDSATTAFVDALGLSTTFPAATFTAVAPTISEVAQVKQRHPNLFKIDFTNLVITKVETNDSGLTDPYPLEKVFWVGKNAPAAVQLPKAGHKQPLGPGA